MTLDLDGVREQVGAGFRCLMVGGGGDGDDKQLNDWLKKYRPGYVAGNLSQKDKEWANRWMKQNSGPPGEDSDDRAIRRYLNRQGKKVEPFQSNATQAYGGSDEKRKILAEIRKIRKQKEQKAQKSDVAGAVAEEEDSDEEEAAEERKKKQEKEWGEDETKRRSAAPETYTDEEKKAGNAWLQRYAPSHKLTFEKSSPAEQAQIMQAAQDPSAAKQDPSAAKQDPSAAKQDPSSTTQDPSSTTQDPSSTSPSPAAPATRATWNRPKAPTDEGTELVNQIDRFFARHPG